jgi:hypothetical protein
MNPCLLGGIKIQITEDKDKWTKDNWMALEKEEDQKKGYWDTIVLSKKIKSIINFKETVVHYYLKRSLLQRLSIHLRSDK